jgi:hypothetical protein
MNYLLQMHDNLLAIVPSGNLNYNTVYKITIKAGISGYMQDAAEWKPMESDYSFWFTSQYCPLFTTVNRIRIETGPAADDLIDDSIYRMIYKNSLDVVDIYNLSNGASNDYTTWGCGPEDIPYMFRRYVECKTAYDILALLESIDASAINQTKSLGDLSIKYSGPSGGGGGKGDPGKKKQLLDCWQQLLNSLNGIAPAVRGYFDESKGFSHPVRDVCHNRIQKNVISHHGNNPFASPWNNHGHRNIF